MKRIRTAVIGCGKVGRIHAAALKSLPESEFTAVCDADPARARHFAEEYQVRAFTNVREMAGESGADSVSICTPHPLHAAAAVTALEAGLRAVVEKPLAVTLADRNARFAAAGKSGRRFRGASLRVT